MTLDLVFFYIGHGLPKNGHIMLGKGITLSLEELIKTKASKLTIYLFSCYAEKLMNNKKVIEDIKK